ncbi:MAG: hypothetical protein KDB07_08505 [Planctomycetes bacterium]|nr:hypothetical protein [Planctomycetota bacterium]
MAKKRKNDNILSASHKAVKGGVKKVRRAKSALDHGIEVLAFFVGIAGFVAIVGLGVLYLWHRFEAESYPSWISPNHFMAYGVFAVFAASFTGWLIVCDGQERLEKKSHRIVSMVFFGLLPLVCLVATVFPNWTAEVSGLPAVDAQPWHPFWIFVRFYPLLLIFLCLWIAFKREAKPRKYFKKKRALKFLLLASPYILVLVFQELSLKQSLVESATDATIGGTAVGAAINIQLIMALMTGTRYD